MLGPVPGRLTPRLQGNCGGRAYRGRMGVDSAAILAVYIAGIGVLYSLRAE
jgi:hypothetical protein